MERELEPKHPGGRPTKRTPEITDQICEAISYGLTDEEVAAMVGIDDSTLTRWKKDREFCGAIKKALATRKLGRLKRIEAGERGWQGTAWAMERQYPEHFSSPEIQMRQRLSAASNSEEQRMLDWLDGERALRKCDFGSNICFC
jgi:Bacteriophage CII protein